jgi:hypothetical protein
MPGPSPPKVEGLFGGLARRRKSFGDNKLGRNFARDRQMFAYKAQGHSTVLSEVIAA